ncbi:hypothetical protein [Cytophaga aurantiaca]|uniref:hypothetical protein n=1 Tax=Cytophaga aurantiaca TaxID=29530 RepID=UPI00036FE5EC|nr:hypothetical protein [Cytophaga aurantiaca]
MYKLLFIFTLCTFVACNTASEDQQETYQTRSEDTSSAAAELLIEDTTMLEFRNKLFIQKYPASWKVDASVGGATIFHAAKGDNPADVVSLNTMILIKPKKQTLSDFADEVVNVKFKTSVAKQAISQQISEQPFEIIKSMKIVSEQQDVAVFYFIEIDKTHIVTEMFSGKLASISKQKKDIDRIYQSVAKPN